MKKVLPVFILGFFFGSLFIVVCFGVIAFIKKETANSSHLTPPTQKTNAQSFDIDAVLEKGLKYKHGDFAWSVLSGSPTEDVILFQMKGEIKNHKHDTENHYLYIISGQAIDQNGTVMKPNQLFYYPKGIAHKARTVGNEPFVFIQFSTPPFDQNKIQWLEK